MIPILKGQNGNALHHLKYYDNFPVMGSLNMINVEGI
jgi:hypothetical protein